MHCSLANMHSDAAFTDSAVLELVPLALPLVLPQGAMLWLIESVLHIGEVVNVKYRTLDKRFRQVKGADKILYGLDDVVGQDTIIIVEGMPDST